MDKLPIPRSQPARQYPLAIIALNGPDNTRATKLVASVISGPDRRDPAAMQKWTTEGSEIRQDRTVAAGLNAFLTRHRVKDRAATGRIIGCPHEAGIDYPLGRTCPRCPFWANIDRFTHEPLTPPVATMSPAEVLTSLSTDLSASPEALSSADALRSELVEPLLAVVDRVVARRRSPPARTSTCSHMRCTCWQNGANPAHIAGSLAGFQCPKSGRSMSAETL